ncbi:MAG: hypothetical protein AB7U05_10185 [Mangrovibacterium sp.]
MHLCVLQFLDYAGNDYGSSATLDKVGPNQEEHGQSILNINRYFCKKQKVMGVQKLREELHDYINHADERFLKMVYAMSKEYKKQPTIVGYNVDGSPITKENLVERAKAASQRVKSGDFLTQEEVEKETENW